MTTRSQALSLFAGLVLLLTSAVAQAAVPREINFQGRLSDDTGTPLNGQYSITFAIWNATTGGTACFTENHPAVGVSAGLFGVNIGSATGGGIATACDFTVPYYLSIQVGADSAMAPRLALTAAAYAFSADTLDGLDNASIQTRDPGTGNVQVTGSLGVGTGSPSQKMDVVGTVKGSSGLCMGTACKGAWPTGTVTSVSAGTGIVLSPNPITSTGSIAVSTSVMQKRVTGTCTGAMRVVNADGTVACASLPSTGNCYYRSDLYTTGSKCRQGGYDYDSYWGYDYYRCTCQSNSSWSCSYVSNTYLDNEC